MLVSVFVGDQKGFVVVLISEALRDRESLPEPRKQAGSPSKANMLRPETE
jgi:hypothetical protein